jgi:hypothetical protein
MSEIPDGTRATVNGNSEAIVIGYDAGLSMYEVRMWSGTRHVGDIIVPASEIHPNTNDPWFPGRAHHDEHTRRNVRRES